MGESFAGITVPDGHPDVLRTAGSTLAGVSGALEAAASELQGMPASLGAWSGPASVAYAGSCLTNSGGVRAGVDATHIASGALRRLGDDLEQAQQQARHAIAQARDAQHRIDQAEHAVAAAQARATDAANRGAAAASEIAISSAVGTPSPGALAEQSRAQSDAANAAADEAHARRELERAREDLRQAQAAGRRAQEHARETARAAAAAFQAAGGVVPSTVTPGGAAGPQGGGGLGTWVQLLGGLAVGVGSDAFTRVLETGAEALSKAARTSVAAYVRGGGWVSGYWRSTPSGGNTWVRPYYRSGGEVSAYTRTNPLSERLGVFGKFAKGGGAVLSFALPAISQVGEDSHDPNLTTTDKVGRATGASAYVGGASLAGGIAGAEAGGAAGAAIGSAVPVVGTAVGGAAGAVIGGVVGSGAAGYLADHTKDFAVQAGQRIANLTVQGAHDVAHGAEVAWNATSGVRHAIGHEASSLEHGAEHVLNDLNPFS